MASFPLSFLVQPGYKGLFLVLLHFFLYHVQLMLLEACSFLRGNCRTLDLSEKGIEGLAGGEEGEAIVVIYCKREE